jgi:diketogulonate reductase-like aldo/keto reductase
MVTHDAQFTVPLNDGFAIPAIGFGTWPLLGADAETTVAQAVETGFRLIDTASKYANETRVGRGIKNSGIRRDQVIIQTKVRGGDQGAKATARGIDASLSNLDVDYLDSLLIHWPLPMLDLYVETWQAMIEAQRTGLVRSIGVSNFLPEHIDRLIAETGVTPAINQIELQPYFSQAEARAYHAAHGIVTQAWGPLGHGRNGVLEDPMVTTVADDAGATPAQVVLAWHHAIGDVPLPKSSNPTRMAENLASLDLELTEEQLAALNALDRGSDARLMASPAVHDER